MKTETINGQRIRCYDDGGKTIDRYTVVYIDQPEQGHNMYAAVSMNASPFHPQGFGQHCTAMVGRHLGKRIAFADLPVDCRRLVERDMAPGSPLHSNRKRLITKQASEASR